ncbi:hypothetical protein [Tessaracoccus oleiagri]|uniref:Amidohydrolase-related domain-containing protein n=1 Tax=Tessaracoccus oleiagri TaxID=686624 RepID=A0A1G9HI90_9ACTN|nr:hypothetical protein [Tessaracoccus oleiagri]SDL12657.1 hypothetical protein SAMN04488242_0331 [Tessaracoccus oleiagri]
MSAPFWPHPGHPDPLADFRGLRAVDTCAWLAQQGRSEAADVEVVEAHCERFGLSEVWLGALDALRAPGLAAARANDRVLNVARRHGRTAPFVTVFPDEGRPMHEWADMGARGVRLAPGRAPGVELGAWLDLVREAAECGLAVQVVARIEDARVALSGIPWADPPPADIALLCDAAHPAGIVISGLNFTEIRTTAGLVDQPRHVRFDLWYVGGPTGAVSELVRVGVSPCFGTAYPLQSPSASALPIVSPLLSLDERKRIARPQLMSHEAESS